MGQVQLRIDQDPCAKGTYIVSGKFKPLSAAEATDEEVIDCVFAIAGAGLCEPDNATKETAARLSKEKMDKFRSEASASASSAAALAATGGPASG